MNETTNEFSSQRELGELYGVSSHVVGKWLKDLGLRTGDGRPSTEAFSGNYVLQRLSTNPGTYYYIWNTEKTTNLFDSMGYPRNK